MKINSINNVNTDVIKKQSAVKQTTGQNEIKQINSLTMAYPQNYYVSFAGGRNTQKAYDDFKDTEMPTTVRNFIENEELVKDLQMIGIDPTMEKIDNSNMIFSNKSINPITSLKSFP